jgi:hypothetical protein
VPARVAQVRVAQAGVAQAAAAQAAVAQAAVAQAAVAEGGAPAVVAEAGAPAVAGDPVDRDFGFNAGKGQGGAFRRLERTPVAAIVPSEQGSDT